MQSFLSKQAVSGSLGKLGSYILLFTVEIGSVTVGNWIEEKMT